jgi:hypothetical protein
MVYLEEPIEEPVEEPVEEPMQKWWVWRNLFPICWYMKR